MGSTGSKVNKIISIFYFVFCIIYLVFSMHFFITGFGGSLLLTITLVPVALILYILDRLRNNTLYPHLGFKVNLIIAFIYVIICIYLLIYLRVEYWNLLYYRQAAFNLMDKITALIIFLLIMEFMRREYKVLFYLSIFLAVYCAYGYLFPGILYHPGVSWTRIIESSTLEFSLGCFGSYAQIGVTTIAAFLLFQSFAAGFGVQNSIVKTILYIFGRRKRLAPQSAVLSSMLIGTISGSGSANVITTGQFTIPLMKKLGFPARFAGAVEASSSLGGMAMPPVMGLAAFLMANFLGVGYWEVVARGYSLALVYYIAVAFSVYLLTKRFIIKAGDVDQSSTSIAKPNLMDIAQVLIFFIFIFVLIYFMGVLMMQEMVAAFRAALMLLAASLISQILLLKAKPADIVNCFKMAIENFGGIMVDIMLILASLGILVNLFTVSGWILKLGMIVIHIGEYSLLGLIATAYALGLFLGLGLPPSVTYILTATIIAPVMMELGVNPWVAHFFAFYLGLVSEYTPPTSITAAVASKLSGAGFMETMIETCKISLPIFLLTVAIFKWDLLVIKPGLMQLYALGIVSIGCMSCACSFFSIFSENRLLNFMIKSLSLILGLIILLYPEATYTIMATPLSILLIIISI